MTEFILEMNNITKEFSEARVLENVNLKVRHGEIHALVGENGAGKSTLMNILSGVYPYGSYSGDIIYEGETCRFRSLRESEEKGIIIVHQELALIPDLSIAENMFLGNERRGRFGIDWEKTYDDAAVWLRKFGLDDDPRTRVRDIGAGKQQLVEIARALSKEPKLLILDEPTSSQNERDSKMLLDLLIELKGQGVSSIIISHKLSELSYCADNITVIRDGTTIETIPNENHSIDEDRIIRGMVGRELNERYPSRKRDISDENGLEVKDWTVWHPQYSNRKIVNDVSFHIRKGEIAGFFGLQGSGRTVLGMSLFGRSYGTNISGEVKIEGRAMDLPTERAAIEAGMAYVTEARMINGLVLTDKIARNTTMARLEKVCRRGIVLTGEENAAAESYRQKLSIGSRSVEQDVVKLSGGNQQKVLLSKWMFADPKVLIIDEPTRGIDVGAKYEIYCILNELAAQGASIMMISSEMPELLGMCDRIYVMNEGRIICEIPASDATQEKIMSAILNPGRAVNEVKE